MENKLFGVGISQAIGLWVFFVLMTVGAKSIVNKYEKVPDGIKKIINAV